MYGKIPMHLSCGTHDLPTGIGYVDQCSSVARAHHITVSQCERVHGEGFPSVIETQSLNFFQGDAQYNTVDSLSAFWPGLQVLGGDIENAIKSHLVCKCRAEHLISAIDVVCQIGTSGEGLLDCRRYGI